MGSPNQVSRKAAEENLGIPQETPWTERPVYGALHITHDHPWIRHGGGAPSYGHAWIQLKPHVKSRSTFTPDDSFNNEEKEHVFTEEHPAALAHAYLDRIPSKMRDHLLTGLGSYDDTRVPYMEEHDLSLIDYIEAQIHGGVNFKDDVDSLHLGTQVYGWHHPDHRTPEQKDKIKRAEEEARAFGIKFRVRVVAHRPEPHPNEMPYYQFADAMRASKEHILYDPAASKTASEIATPEVVTPAVADVPATAPKAKPASKPRKPRAKKPAVVKEPVK